MIKTVILFTIFIVLLVIPFVFSLADIAKKADEDRERMFYEYLRNKPEKEDHIEK